MVRVMMFHSLLIEIGITGWMLRMFCVPFSGPKLRLVLFWKGRLIRFPTGFCASFASSVALISAFAGPLRPTPAANRATLTIPHFIARFLLFPIRTVNTPRLRRGRESSANLRTSACGETA